MSAMPRHSFLLFPPERFPAFVSAYWSRPTLLIIALTAPGNTVFYGIPARLPARVIEVVTVKAGSILLFYGQ